MRQSFSRSNSCFRIAMRLVSFCTNASAAPPLGIRKGAEVADLGPGRMRELLASGPAALERARKATGPLLEERANELLAVPFEPGDMFSTGAPGGVAVGKPNAAELFLKPGDVVECSIEGITTLRTHIV